MNRLRWEQEMNQAIDDVVASVDALVKTTSQAPKSWKRDSRWYLVILSLATALGEQLAIFSRMWALLVDNDLNPRR